MDVVNIIGGIISAVPEAVKLWETIAPLITEREGISPEKVATVEKLVPVAHDIVRQTHAAIEDIIALHASV